MNTSALEKALRRLKDIVVNELSLVDRPANQEPFLLMKRSEPVGETTEFAEPTETASDPGGSSPESTTQASNPTLAVAVHALESLTQAVESLDSDEGLGEMESELRETLGALMSHLGVAAPAVPTAPAETPASDEGKSKIVAELRRAIDELKAATENAPAPEPAKAEPDGVERDKRVDQVRDALASLESTVREFGETVNKQGERLAHVEKQFGLPNSQAPGGNPKPPPAAAGWPFDLNAPRDRDNVEKSVSFHDI